MKYNNYSRGENSYTRLALHYKAYGTLSQAYRFKYFLTAEVNWRLSETYILSQFNYDDIIFQGLNNEHIRKIQKVQNSCIRYSYGLRK